MRTDGFAARTVARAELLPNTVAVRDAAGEWTWSELLDHARRYAAGICAAYPSENALPAVPILVGRNRLVVAAILGTLLAERAFAPLSIKHPPSRVIACMKRLGAAHLVSALGADEQVPFAFENQIVEIPLESETFDIVLPGDTAEQLLYILFTSGSTGIPKGVLCTHDNIINTMLWSADFLHWTPEDVAGCAVQFSFDISMFDVFTTLFFGVPLTILDDPGDVSAVIHEIERHEVTSIFAVPAFFSQFLSSEMLKRIDQSSLRRIVSGGDFFPPSHMLRWLHEAPTVEVLNVWGPTETSIVNTMHAVVSADFPALREGRHAPVGVAHPRMRFVLIEENEQPVVNPGERGEIWMLDDSVTVGYLSDDEQTERAYVSFEGRRAFRTGDIGFLDDEQRLHIAGRTGTIVKVAGFRIDLAEVEGAAASLPQVHQAAAFVQEITDGIKELWLGVEPSCPSGDLDIFSAKRELRRSLPSYMVPKRMFVFNKLPLNANQKIDRRATKASVEERLIQK